MNPKPISRLLTTSQRLKVIIHLQPKELKTAASLLLLITLALAALSACSFSLTGDVTPPPDYSPAGPTAIPTNAGPVYPLVPPDPQDGAAIYADKCVPCHGAGGLGDGSQAANLPNPVAAIGSAALARQSIPNEWYTIITNGNTDRYMMPFGNSLSDRQRWDVLAYVYTLSSPVDFTMTGKTIYDANCAACHGAAGKGDGTQAASLADKPTDFTNQQIMALVSESKLFEAITSGISPAMPAFKGKLSEEQRRMVASYLRALTFASQSQAYPAPTQETVAQAATSTPAAAYPSPAESTAAAPAANTTETATASTLGSVSGTVTNGSGGELPAGLTVTLQGYDSAQLAVTLSAEVQADGSYLFNDVDMPSGRVFMASVVNKAAEFDSDVVHIQSERTLDMPITLYDSSTDPSALVADSVHVIFDFTQQGTVQVIELLVITNPTDKMIVAEQTGQPVLDFAIPTGATNLQVDEGELGERYLQTASGIGDTGGIIPGSRQHQIGFAYNLPYTEKLDLSIAIPLPANLVTFMLPTNAVKLQSSQLAAAGQQSAQGMELNLYTADNIQAGSVIKLTLSGNPSTAGPTSSSQSNNGILIGAGVLAVAVGVSGFFIYRSRRRTAPAEPPEESGEETAEDADALLDEIVALDDIHNAGKLPDAAYQKRRAELKEKLGKALHKPL